MTLNEMLCWSGQNTYTCMEMRSVGIIQVATRIMLKPTACLQRKVKHLYLNTTIACNENECLNGK